MQATVCPTWQHWPSVARPEFYLGESYSPLSFWESFWQYSTSRDVVLAVSVFTLATVVYTYPLITSPTTANRLDTPDALLNAWIVSWNVHQLRSDPMHVFDANIFFPDEGALAYSENLVTGGLLASPIGLVNDHPIVLFNAVLVLGFILSALCTCADRNHENLFDVI